MPRRVAMASPAALLSLLVSCFGGGGGGDGEGGGAGAGSSGGSSCAQAEALLRRCNLLSEGYFDCSEPDDEFERCTASCQLSASCDEIEIFACVDIGSLEEAMLLIPSLADCIEACRPPDFTCANGGDIPGTWVCDGDNDCGDLSDEQDCDSMESRAFECDDGDRVPAYFECDGFPDCVDLSDEIGCPTFECDDGDEVPDSYRCDGSEDCFDGSDEADCAELQCG